MLRSECLHASATHRASDARNGDVAQSLVTIGSGKTGAAGQPRPPPQPISSSISLNPPSRMRPGGELGGRYAPSDPCAARSILMGAERVGGPMLMRTL